MFDNKVMVNFKIYDNKDWTIHILPNISRIKSNPTMKCDQIIKYSMRNIFVTKHVKHEIGKLVPNLFLFCFLKELYTR